MSAEPLGQVPLGERVTVRHRLPDGRASDSVGTLTARDGTSVTLRTRRGEVRVPLASVVVHRVVRAVPWRIATFLGRAGVAVLALDGVVREAAEGTPLPRTVALVDELVAARVPVVVLADGRPAPGDLEGGALAHLAPMLLTVADLARPTPEGYAAAHARIEERLGRRVPPAQVHLTDARPGQLAAAREFGWQARVFTQPQ